MNYFEISYTAIGGLGLFFLGLRYLSESLQSSGKEAIKRILATLTKNRMLAVLAGVGITVFVQSSSISTVMTVSLVNAGLMELKQAIGVILGANIGTTITGWIISIKVGKYGLLLIGLGVYPMLAASSSAANTAGKALVALGLIFTGLEFMSGAFAPLRTDANFISYLYLFDAETLLSLLACVLVGCLLTVIIQSSSAMLGITMTLASTGVIDFDTAVGLIIGENIGTTITAQLAAFGANTSAVRAARAHAIFNILGALLFVSVFPFYVTFIDSIVSGPADLQLADGSRPNIAWHIAVAHTMFNVLNVLFWIPLIGTLTRFVTWLVPQKEGKEIHKLKYLGTQATMAPEVALQQADLEMDNMVEITREMFAITRQYCAGEQHDKTLFERINHLEDITDNIEEEMINFITILQTNTITRNQSTRAYTLVRMADEIESIADSLQSLSIYRSRLYKRKEGVSPAAWHDILSFYDDVSLYFDKVVEARRKHVSMPRVEVLLQESRKLNKVAKKMREQHMDRIKEGTCHSIPAQTFSDMFVTLKHIKSHSLNFLQAYAGIP
ncbi:MAG: Na/Pi cotransporter family protein [Pseudomonadales bacterium]|nr:Na/Pi cotransporter family protein [Pseudomonadales bacterium]